MHRRIIVFWTVSGSHQLCVECVTYISAGRKKKPEPQRSKSSGTYFSMDVKVVPISVTGFITTTTVTRHIASENQTQNTTPQTYRQNTSCISYQQAFESPYKPFIRIQMLSEAFFFQSSSETKPKHSSAQPLYSSTAAQQLAQKHEPIPDSMNSWLKLFHASLLFSRFSSMTLMSAKGQLHSGKRGEHRHQQSLLRQSNSPSELHATQLRAASTKRPRRNSGRTSCNPGKKRKHMVKHLGFFFFLECSYF